jgi:hypothetical protein
MKKELCSSETSVTFNGIHGVVSQKIERFIAIAGRTSITIVPISSVLLYETIKYTPPL